MDFIVTHRHDRHKPMLDVRRLAERRDDRALFGRTARKRTGMPSCEAQDLGRYTHPVFASPRSRQAHA